MHVSFTQYKNSRLATILDATGSLICIMPALMVVSVVAELISGAGKLGDIEVTEVIAGIVTIGIYVLMGIGLKKLGRKVALNKQKKEMEKQRLAYYQHLQNNPSGNQMPDSNQTGGQPGTARICPACGTALQPDDRYCPNCGSPYFI